MIALPAGSVRAQPAPSPLQNLLSSLTGNLGESAAPVAMSPSTTLSAVQHLVASVSGDQATVSWQPPVSGTVGRYQVDAFFNGVPGVAGSSPYGTRIAGPTATSLVWDRIPFNQPMQFEVTAIGPDNADYTSGPAGPVNATGVVTASNSYCPTATNLDCVLVNTTQSLGTETRPGAGLLHGTVAPGNQWLPALKISHWRIGNDNEYKDVLGITPGRDTTVIMSDNWENLTSTNGGPAADPWTNWTTYTQFITAEVEIGDDLDVHPCWDIQNEPENYPYATQPPSRADVEEQYLYAYQAIKAVDPKACVIGPSIDWEYEDPQAPIDMKTFIPFAAANGMQFTAISWHDNYDESDQNPLNYSESPEAVRDQAEEVRQLIAENPGIGHPKLYVNENSSAAGNFIPGFAAGYLAEEDRAGLAEANRTCWGYPGDSSPQAVYQDCFGPNLDQLLNPDGVPNNSYWVYADYASMTGDQVWSATSDTNLSSLSVTDSSNTTRILLGRHQTCSGWTGVSNSATNYCPAEAAPPTIPTRVNVLVPTGATSAAVTVQEIADGYGDQPKAPATKSSEVAVAYGLAQVTLPAVGDGEAYFLTVTPNTASGQAPATGNGYHAEKPSPTGTSVPTRILGEYTVGQTTTILQTFSDPMVALVTDQYGNPLPNIPVTFAVPAGEAQFSGGPPAVEVTTNTYGIATSPALQATAYVGSFTGIAFVNSLATGPITYYGFTTTL
jgi:hypothetical protein